MAPEYEVTPGQMIGSGARGVVFHGRYQGARVALKVFAYQEEARSQREALQALSQCPVTPDALHWFSRSLVMPLLAPGTRLKGRHDDLLQGLEVARLLHLSSPSSRPGWSVLASDCFGERLQEAKVRNARHALFSSDWVSGVGRIFDSVSGQAGSLIHGDLGVDNLILDHRPMAIDPRGFLWGDPHLYVAKWVMVSAPDVDQGLQVCSSLGYDTDRVKGWIAVQAYDDSTAFCTVGYNQHLIPGYHGLVERLVTELG